MYVTVVDPVVDGKDTYIQCLLFVLRKEFSENTNRMCDSSNQMKTRGFVLLHPSVSEHDGAIAQLFLRHNFEILDNQNRSCLQKYVEYNVIEMLELVLQRGNREVVFPSKNTPFFPISIESGHHEQVRQLFGKDAAVYWGEDYSVITASRAINGNNYGIMEFLLTGSIHISYRNLLNETLLHLAVRRSDESFLKLLIKHGADVNARSKDCLTPLHIAAERGNLTTCSLLLQNGAAVNARRKDGSTSLFLAIKMKRFETAQLLLKSGADVNIGKNNGLMPLHVACKSMTDIIDELLLKEAIVNASATYCHAQGITPLCLAVENKDLTTVKCLLSHGADVNIPCYDDQTILKLAVDLDCPDIVQEILKFNPDLNNKINNEAFYVSMSSNNENSDTIAQMLSQHGFGGDFGFDNSSDFLHIAISGGYINVVERLIKSGISVDRVYHYFDKRSARIQQTNPLLTAIRHDRNDIVKLLCDLGADVNVSFELESGHENLIEFAEESKNSEAMKILLTSNITFGYTAIVNDGWEYFVPEMIMRSNNKDLIEKLICECAKVHGTSSLTSTLFDAVVDGKLEVITELVKFGVYVDSRNDCGHTSLHRLAQNKSCSEVMKFLIKNNADIEARCFNGETPLIAAAKRGNCEGVSELLKYGAQIYSVDNFGRSSLDYVIAEGYYKIFRYILDYFFADTEFILRTNIPQLLSFSRLSNLKYEDDPYLYERFRRHAGGFENCSMVWKSHLLKMKAAFSTKEKVFLFIKQNLEAMDSGEYVPNLFERFGILHEDFPQYTVEKINDMKTKFIGDTGVTFYDILTNDVLKLTRYARNSSIVNNLETTFIETSYNCYKNILSYQIQKGTFRRKLLDQSIELCPLLVSQFNVLPADLKEEILNYLSNRDLEVLVHACLCISPG